MLLAAALTWAAHSSVAVVLLVMTLAEKGVVPPVAAFALVLGANLGTAINPLLEGAASEGGAGRRLPMGNLVNGWRGSARRWRRSAGSGAGWWWSNPTRRGRWRISIPGSTSCWRCCSCRCCGRSPASSGAGCRTGSTPPTRRNHSTWPRRRGRRPTIALAGAVREALRMVDVLDAMLRGAWEALDGSDRKQVGETRRLDDVLDRLNTAIKAYVTGLDADDLSPADHRRVSQILAFTTNLEHAGDVLDRNVMALAVKRTKRGVALSAGRPDRTVRHLRPAVGQSARRQRGIPQRGQ